MKRTHRLRAGTVRLALKLSALPVLTAPGVAFAQPPPPAPPAMVGSPTTPAVGATPSAAFSPSELQEAEDRFREARALYEDGKVDDARVKYAQAFAVLQRSSILWNLAIAEFYAGRKLDALAHFKQFVERTDAEPGDVKRAREKYIPEAAAATGHVKVDAAPGLEVVVDGKKQPGATPLATDVDVAPGTHVIEARFGGRAESRSVACSPGETIVLTFTIRPPAPSSRREYVPVYPKARAVLAIGLGAAALAAGGVGAIFALDSKSKNDDNRRYATENGGLCAVRGSAECAGWQTRLDNQQSAATLSRVLYVGAGVLAAGAVVTWFMWPKPKRESAAAAAWFAPSPLPGGAAVHAGGVF